MLLGFGWLLANLLPPDLPKPRSQPQSMQSLRPDPLCWPPQALWFSIVPGRRGCLIGKVQMRLACGGLYCELLTAHRWFLSVPRSSQSRSGLRWRSQWASRPLGFLTIPLSAHAPPGRHLHPTPSCHYELETPHSFLSPTLLLPLPG